MTEGNYYSPKFRPHLNIGRSAYEQIPKEKLVVLRP